MSKQLVIDVNIVLIWLNLQSPDLYKRAVKLFRASKKREIKLIAPDFLLIELINILKWRLKVGEKKIAKILEIISGTGILFVHPGVNQVRNLNHLVHSYNLTAYDAPYLFAAQENKCNLVTLDEKLLEVKNWSIRLNTIDLK